MPQDDSEDTLLDAWPEHRTNGRLKNQEEAGRTNAEMTSPQRGAGLGLISSSYQLVEVRGVGRSTPRLHREGLYKGTAPWSCDLSQASGVFYPWLRALMLLRRV